MNKRIPVLSLLAVAAVMTFLPVPTTADHECDPYPIGRCGDYQREVIIFCYVMVDGQYVSATDGSALGAPGLAQHGVSTGVGQLDESAFYVRTDPASTFVEDPYNAPFIFGTVWMEDNNVVGLQTQPFKCGKWVWFAECEPMQWMGPTGVKSFEPDLQLF